MAFVKVCKIADVENSKGKVVNAGSKEIALFNVNGTFFALDNACPHRGGPLGEGDLYKGGSRISVTCPWHGYMFDIKTGEGINFPTGVKTHKVKVEGGEIFVEV